MVTNNARNIWLQPGTRVHMVVDRVSHWEVWTATDKRTGDSAAWLGTYFELYWTGEVIQCIRTNTDMRRFVIREPRTDPLAGESDTYSGA